ncbi:vacuolar protein sorting-associated protein VTA1, putative [Plasmodium reichenowi]|uniref:Vacuolar protein sorting-associated protein VTA1, putative n=3 Tax=Plasmodium reichenowi TaxID=5854 RepID=A0A060RRI5_PLARE|nr:vacuolar protein sorting-associated protein VTA1, putative [Plasmodium reichenowi]SOV74884.1 vacuolar protein sorting-associated protein VTA1, putative [Plasmodium reichenowi]
MVEGQNDTSLGESKKINMKSIEFVIKKSEELETNHSLVSFLCILYVVEKLNDYVKVNYTDTDRKNVLIKCLNKAEEMRPSFGSLDYNVLSNFCEKLFLAADKNDRNEVITKKTLQMFFTSKIFYEILNHFKNLSTEENKKYVYAKYKTIYLKKCFDNNITPEPGSPQNEDAVSEVDKRIDDEDKEEEEQITNDKYEHYEENNNDYYKGREKLGTQSKGTEDSVDFNLSLKHAQYAVNALIFEDRDTAKRELKLSLSYLE